MGYIDIVLIIISLGLLIFSVRNKKMEKKYRIIIGTVSSIVLFLCAVGFILIGLLITAID